MLAVSVGKGGCIRAGGGGGQGWALQVGEVGMRAERGRSWEWL